MRKKSKTALIVGTAVIAGLVYAGVNFVSLEQPSYRVVDKRDGIEYRQYEPYLVSETVIERAGDYKDAGNEGFRRLFRYISGGNAGQSKISMTVPVKQTATSEKIAMTVPVEQSAAAEGWRVAFMLPSEYTLETAPQPTDKRVSIREVPGKLTAVLRFSGRWTDSNYAKKRAALLEALEEKSVTPVGEVQNAFYNGPYTPPFLRRNEVLVEIDRLPAGANG
ncbi:MAG: heme-binding protein [Gammaproteobacteria bacterium]|nr:heme-binding protein [Gammaproteobacteria bacterium]